MRPSLLLTLALAVSSPVLAADTVTSPDGRLVVTVDLNQGRPCYTLQYDGHEILQPSQLGIVANYADFSKDLKPGKVDREEHVVKDYDMTRTKQTHYHYVANKLRLHYTNAQGNGMAIAFSVADNSVAFRYELERPGNRDGNPRSAYIVGEATSFRFPDATSTFLCQQSGVMTGFARTKPSYEEDYEADVPMTQRRSQSHQGFTFPCLFRVPDAGQNYWALVSETGVTSSYCGCRLSDFDTTNGYTVCLPQQGENNGIGSITPAVTLPSATPWRTIVVGSSLKPIAESTVQFDVVDPLYEAKQPFKPGRYTWSWILWGDQSMNYDDQKRYVDLAAEMGYEYVLVDALWDTQVGYDGIERLAKYAAGKGVGLMLWYNSNGVQNDAPQGPHGVMGNTIRRKADMAWMQRIGVKGIKVDFFGGDKQQTMQLYEDILSDANDYGIQVIFHGCTLPRGWERMYPNYISSEAALASENVNFSDWHARREGFELTMHPFSRNAVGSFDWGGIFMNKHFSRDNKSRHQRYTSDIFELATGITNQTSINCVAIAPNNLTDMPKHVLDFARTLPTTWEETQLIDGYPTRYCVMARRHAGQWYVGGLNGTNEPMTLRLHLPMLAGKTVTYYTDRTRHIRVDTNDKWSADGYDSDKLTLKVDRKGYAKVTMQPLGGIIIVEEK